jgi:sialidase-1
LKYLTLCIILIGAENNISVSAETSTTGIDAASSQRVHPVLIRNEYNGLVTVAIEVDKPGVRVTEFTFSLDGTDDLRDIESLAFYSSDRHDPRRLEVFRNGNTYAGDKQAVTAELTVPFGEVSLPANQVIFKGNQLLAPGVNFFWLSCKLNPAAELSHKVDAACTKIETASGTLAPKDTTPGVRKRIGYALRKRYDDAVHTSRIPALTVTPQGTLLCTFDMRRTKRRDLQEDVDVGLMRNTDGGRSWEPVRVIMDIGEHGGLP